MERDRNVSPLQITVPRRTLLVLCGPAASGKSTFASQQFATSMVVSSDYCRELICDDSNNQHVNRDAFDLFYYIINKRMYLSRFTIADSTALQANARLRLLEFPVLDVEPQLLLCPFFPKVQLPTGSLDLALDLLNPGDQLHLVQLIALDDQITLAF